MRTRPHTSLRYEEAVNLAIDHVVRHLEEPLRLAQVGRRVGLSPFHFHRVFQALMGQTLAEFVKRLRLERALRHMAHGPRATLTTIALRCGFSSSSDFSRCFKQRFGVAPSAFDLAGWRKANGSQLEGRLPERFRLRPRENPDGFRVTVRTLAPRTVAYVRVRDPYRPDAVTSAAQRMIRWAEEHALADGQWLGYQWEHPEFTALEDCQYHVAVEAERFVARGEVGRFAFPAMKVAEIEVRGDIELEIRALQYLYGPWLAHSGYVPDEQPCFEAWFGKPFAHGTEHFELRVQLPVLRASV